MEMEELLISNRYPLENVCYLHLHNNRNSQSVATYCVLVDIQPSNKEDATPCYSSRIARYLEAWHWRRRWRCAASLCSSGDRPDGSISTATPDRC